MTATGFALALAVRIGGITLPQDVSDHITSATVTHVLNAMDSFELTIANLAPGLLWTSPASEALFHEGGQIAIALGYVEDAPTLIEGVITKIRAQFPDSGAPTVVISGYSHLYALQSQAPRRPFSLMTDQQMVESVAVQASLTPLVAPTPVLYQSIQPSGETALAFVIQLAARIDYEVTSVGRQLIFRPHGGDQPSAYTLVWGHPTLDIALLGGAVPLRRLDVTLDLAGQVSSVTVHGTDTTSGGAIAERVGAPDEPDTPPLVIFNTPAGSVAEANVVAQAMFNQRRRQLVTVSGATAGLPYLRAGQVVELAGIGRFSGRYYLTETAHTLGDGGYETSFSAEQEPTL
jgi:Bacteriophage probable baseplate hub protein